LGVIFPKEIKAAIECLLFVAGDPLPLAAICESTGLGTDEAQQLLEELAGDYDRAESGLRIRQVAHGYQLCTRPEYAPYIERLGRSATQGLSNPALETVAIIAYRQPVTRSEIEHVRGVKVDGVINTLLDRGLIKELGRREGVGRPIIYGTTDTFLRYFGLRDLSELPRAEGSEEPRTEAGNSHAG